MPDVGILIKAKDEASGTIKNVKSSLNELGKATGEATSLSGAFSQLGGAIGLAAAAAGAFKIGQTAVEMAQASAQIQRLEDSYITLASQAGISADSMLSALQRASNGTISNADLMLNANKALVLGVSSSSDEISKLLEVAVARGKALGRSATDAFSDIITGIGRESPLILDNIGIKIADITRGISDYAAAHGKVVEALTGEERKRAIVNVAIASSAALVRANAAAGDDAASSFERAAAAFANLKADLGELFGPAIAAFAEQLAQVVDKAAGAVRESGKAQVVDTTSVEQQIAVVDTLTDQLEAAKDALAELQDQQSAAQSNGVSNAAEQQLQRDRQAQIEYQQSIVKSIEAQIAWANSQLYARQNAEATAAASASLANQINALTGTYPQLNAANVEASRAMEYQRIAAANLQSQIVALANTYPAAATQIASAAAIIRQSVMDANQAAISSIASVAFDTTGASGAVRVYGQLTDQVDQQVASWQTAGYTQDQITNILLPGYLSQLRRATTETYGIKAAQAGVNAAIKQANQQYEDLASKVSGVLSGALGDIAGVNLDEILPRQDAVGEDARRLADVAVNGFASPWADYLANKFPDTIGAAFANGGDVKQTAAQLLKDFQDGLRPELLDKNRAKELVKRAIIGEQNMKALTDEIAKELAGEMGISVAQAQQAAVSALGGGATGVGAATPDSKQVPIVPVIDTSKLPTTPITISGAIDSVTVSQTVKDYELSVSAQITTISIAETVTNPQIASTAAIGEIVIADGAKAPTPVITGGLTIDAISVRSDAKLPEISVAATIGILTLDAAIQNPQITIAGVIGSMTIAEGVKPPDIVLPAGAFVNVVSLASTAVLPDVTLTANIVAVQLDASAATETPLALSARVTPFIDTSLMDQGNIDAARTFITEVLPVNVTPYITTEGIDTSSALTYLEQELAPIVTPYVNYLGILPEDLTAAGTHIASGIADGIAKYNLGNAIITELNKAQLAMRNAGITNGQNWGAGFNSGATEYITSIVSTVVTLALAQMTKNTTRTGAQG